MTTRLALAAGLALLLAPATPRAQPPGPVDALLARVGERLAHFYARAATVVLTERSMVQPIDGSYSPQGFARTVESELRVELEGGGSQDAQFVRTVRKVNGRAPREDDKTARAGCTDPNPLSAEPLSFLMPHRRHAYRFEAARPERDGDRDVVVVGFSSVITRSRLELIAAPSGHDDCFDWSGPLASRGRIVLDAEGLDVLRVEQHLPGPVEVRVPPLFQRRHHFDNWISLVRDDMTIRYARVAFDDPDEVLLLPEAIDTVTIVRGGLQSTRRSHRFSDYRRFVTGGRVVR